jgi:hypothetical protein
VFGGVLITKGMPIAAAMTIRIIVDGEGSRLPASGMSMVAVAVLLIRAESVALEKQSTSSRTKGELASMAWPLPRLSL